MKIAIASSGLGHVARGIETWALDTAEALAARGIDVTLFSGAAVADPPDALGSGRCVSLDCLQRNQPGARWRTRLTPSPAWRWGLKDTYGWEQRDFWRRLEPHLKSGAYDMLHVQDPMVAFWCQRAFSRGRLATRVILAHGTEEPTSFLASFDFVQQLAPWHLEQSQSVVAGRPWAAIPNFVDTEVFRPATDATERAACRRELGVPPEGHLIGCSAAVKRSHKRIDYLVTEFAAWVNGPSSPNAHLLIAGARQADTADLMQLAESLAPDRIHFAIDCPREQMPRVYRALDLFVLTSLFEMMPIAILEALASGLPMLVNDHPVLEWMSGDGGKRIAMDQPGGLASELAAWDEDSLLTRSVAARERAETVFSRDAVIGRYIDYYQRVMT